MIRVVPVEPTNEFLWYVSGSSICEPAGTIAENLPKEVAEIIVRTHNQEIEAFCRREPISAEQWHRFFIDTEFIESGPNRPIELLSIALVAEDGREFYAVNSDAVLANANEWVQENVIPPLGGPRLSLADIRGSILRFIGDVKPEFWGYYADYDWVVFCQIFGAMIDLPEGWPMFCRDLKQRCSDLGNPKLPKQGSTEHNALNDARWNASIFQWLRAYAHSLTTRNEEEK